MNNLTTRKIVLELLMTLVLVFSVQGVVDAVTATVPGAANAPDNLVDITARQVGSDIGSDVGTTAGIAITSITLEDTKDDPGVGNHLADPPDPTATDKTNTNESITVSTTNIQLTAPTFTRSTVTFSESRDPDTATSTQQSLYASKAEFDAGAETSRSITLQGYFISPGKATLTIRYTDLSDSQSNASEGSTTSKTITHTYTFYAVKADADIPETTTLRLTQDSRSVHNEGYVTGLNGRTDFRIFSNNTGNYPVTYSVAGTGGGSGTPTLYFNDDPYTASDPSDSGTTISSSSGRKVWLDMNGSGAISTFSEGRTSVVTVHIGQTGTAIGSKSSFNVAYISGAPKLDINLVPANGSPVTGGTTSLTGTDSGVTANANDARDRYGFTGGAAGNNVGTITATVGDGEASLGTDTGNLTGGTIEGVLVKFELQQRGPTTGYLRTTGTRVDERNNTKGLGPSPPGIAQTLYVRTGSDGTAVVTYTFGTLGSQTIKVSSVGLSKNVTAEIGSGQTDERISVKTNRQQSSNPKKYDLVAEVEDGDGEPVSNKVVTFSADRGTLTPITTSGSSGEEVMVTTNEHGEAHVVYDIGSNTGRQEIRASFVDGTDRESVTFVINGSSAPRTTTTQARLTITATPVTSEDTERTVTVNAISTTGTSVPNYPVVLGSLDFTLSQNVNTGTPVQVTLPSTPDTYTLLAADPVGIYQQGSVTLTVSAPPALGTLNVTAIDAPVNGQQTIEVTVRNADGTAPSGSVTVALSGAVTRNVETLNGRGRAIITLPATASYTLTLTADGYTTREVTLSTTPTPTPTPTPTTPTPTTPTPTPTVSEPSSIQISGPAVRTGVTVNQQLDAPLLVQVLDEDGSGVPDARVIFTRRTGQGRLSDRGAGRAVAAQTDARGFARADYTPESATSTVEAEVRGVTNIVTFTISTGSAPPTTPRDTGTGTTPRTTEINPVVHVAAANRPSILWVDDGAIYALIGASPQKFAPSVDNALNITIGAGKVYWTEKTGESAGTINSANLDGTGVTELKTIMAVPMGIAVDGTNDKLYWTNSRGRIQSANLNGSGITNVIPGGLEGAMDLALSGGNAYWTQGGNVRFVNLSGQKQIRNISTGTDTAGSLAIGGGKVYWTEMTGESAGTINSANLDGTGATELASILATPKGIAVDSARSKLYWTNSRGRVQRANLNGSSIQNVVTGLGNPGEIIFGDSLQLKPTATTTTPTTASNKYDVNGDGTVDSKDSDALIVAVAAGVTDAKYDVNGDGKVDINDVVAVTANRSAGAASAPTLLGTKLSALEIDTLQEQIDLLIATGDRSPAAMRTLIYLQQLIVMARPEKTQLLANYPNPFNPETWIPYELATDTSVKITIYNTHGVVIRTLELGHQSAGYYTGRDRAAYWDGRNAFGEQVASGIYFYQFETDEMSSMRKMVILK